jgi:Sulphur transport
MASGAVLMGFGGMLAGGCAVGAGLSGAAVFTYSKKAKFEDVRDDLKTAIESKGLVIDYQSQINTMLERTGKDVGSSRKLYVDAQSLHGHRREVARAQAQVHGELL